MGLAWGYCICLLLVPHSSSASTDLDLISYVHAILDGRMRSESAFLLSCAFPTGSSCLQLSEPLLGGEATKGHVSPVLILDPPIGQQQFIASRSVAVGLHVSPLLQ
jgi:hypothetical protein